jgi:hypothetical protein
LPGGGQAGTSRQPTPHPSDAGPSSGGATAAPASGGGQGQLTKVAGPGGAGQSPPISATDDVGPSHHVVQPAFMEDDHNDRPDGMGMQGLGQQDAAQHGTAAEGSPPKPPRSPSPPPAQPAAALASQAPEPHEEHQLQSEWGGCP